MSATNVALPFPARAKPTTSRPTTRHLYTRQGAYYFRLRIPADIRAWFGRDEFKRSLHTKSVRTANRLLKSWEHKAERVFTLVRTGMLTDAQVRKLVEEFFHKSLAENEEYRATFGPNIEWDEEPGAWLLNIAYADMVEGAKRYLYDGEGHYIEPIVDNVLEEREIALEKGSTTYKKLCRQIALAHIGSVLGHVLEYKTTACYTGKYPPKVKLEAMQKADFGVDLSHLNKLCSAD